jgi:hypothetical protein
MTADPFRFVDPDDVEEASRLRRVIAAVFILLFTLFLFEAMDGVERAAEQAERRENALRAACRDPAWAMTDAAANLDGDDEERTPVDADASTLPTTDPVTTASADPASIPVTPAHFTPAAAPSR